MKSKTKYFVIIFASFSSVSFAQSITDNTLLAKQILDKNPAMVSKAIQITPPVKWATCTSVYLKAVYAETSGTAFDKNSSQAFATLGAAMIKVRDNLEAKGMSKSQLDAMLKNANSVSVSANIINDCKSLALSLWN